MEENFEKKSGKKIAITMSVILVVLILALVAGVLYLNYTRKPQQIFSKAIEDAFKVSENTGKRGIKIDLEFSLDMESNDSEIVMMNEILKSLKLKSTTEMDLDKKIFNENIKATYAGQEIINADALIQDNKMYFYLNEIYSKFIEVSEEYYEGEDLSSIFDVETEISTEQLLEDIEKVLVDEINTKEFKQEKVELDGRNVQKTTLRLTPKEVLQITVKVLDVINQYQPTTELQELIEDLKTEIQYSEETENYINISIYTKGLNSELVKAEIVLVDAEYDEVIAIELNAKSDDEFEFNYFLNEKSTKIEEAEKIMEITVKLEEENKGTAKIKMHIDEENSVSVNIKYEFDYNAKIEKRDTSNSINIDNLTDADYQEMYENIEDNVILYSIIEQFMYTEEDYIEEDIDFEDEYNYYQEPYNFDYDYIY